MLFVIFFRIICILLTNAKYDAKIGVTFARLSKFVYICSCANNWVTKPIYTEIIRFVMRASSDTSVRLFIDDVCTGHGSKIVKSLLYNARFEYKNIPGGLTGTYFQFFLFLIVRQQYERMHSNNNVLI